MSPVQPSMVATLIPQLAKHLSGAVGHRDSADISGDDVSYDDISVDDVSSTGEDKELRGLVEERSGWDMIERTFEQTSDAYELENSYEHDLLVKSYLSTISEGS